MLDDVEKPAWKQVGFFMSGFDSSCQYICLKSNQFCDFFKFYQCVNVQNYPHFLWINFRHFVRFGSHQFWPFAAMRHTGIFL